MEKDINSQAIPNPLEFSAQEVLPEWIDYNGHMNVAYYVLSFDRGVDSFLEQIGITSKYIEIQQASTFTLELHVTYLQELSCGDPIRMTCQLLDVDQKRVHFFFRMYHGKDGFLAATAEQILMHIDMNTRRAAPFPDPIFKRLELILTTHGDLPWPDQAGNAIAIRRK